MNGNYRGLDVLKLLLAALVTVLHLQPTADINDSVTYYLTNGICRIAVPCFFFLTGFLYESQGKDFGDANICKKRIKKMFKLYLAWTIMLMPAIIYDFATSPKYADTSIVYCIIIFIRRFFLVGSWTPLWFFLGGGYAVALLYFLSKLKLRRTTILILLGLVTLASACMIDCYAALGGKLFGSVETINNIWLNLQRVTGTIWVEVIWAAFYMMYGMLFQSVRNNRLFDNLRRYRWILLIIGIALLELEVVLFHALGSVNFSKMISLVVIIPILVDIFADSKISSTDGRSIVIRRLSVLIYGFHIFVSSIMIWELNINSIMRYCVVMVITIVCSVIVLFLSKRVKILRWLY